MRRIPVWVFIVIAILYLGIVQGLARLLTADIEVEYAAPTSITELWRSITVPVGVSLLFVYGVVAFLGWWRPVFVDDRPVQRWVLAVPVIMLVAVVAGTTYGGLADRGLAFTALLLCSTLLVGFSKEGMFRGAAWWPSASTASARARGRCGPCRHRPGGPAAGAAPSHRAERDGAIMRLVD